MSELEDLQEEYGHLTEAYQSALAANEQLARVIIPGDLVASFQVPGQWVKPKERPRTGKGRTYTPQATKQAEQVIGFLFREAVPGWKVDSASRFAVHMMIKGSLADGDNVQKMILDGLQGVAYANDRQVRVGRWEMSDGPKGARVDVYRMRSSDDHQSG